MLILVTKSARADWKLPMSIPMSFFCVPVSFFVRAGVFFFIKIAGTVQLWFKYFLSSFAQKLKKFSL